MLERAPDGRLVQVRLVGLAPHPGVDRRPVALDAAGGGGLERLAGVGVPVAPDVADEPASAGSTDQEPREPVLAAVDAPIRAEE